MRQLEQSSQSQPARRCKSAEGSSLYECITICDAIMSSVYINSILSLRLANREVDTIQSQQFHLARELVIQMIVETIGANTD